jgi:hypothetical protein
MGRLTIDYNLVSLIVAIVSLVVAFASLVVAGAAAKIAKNSLSQAERVAERDLRDWKQRTWADVYFKGDEAHDALNAFQVQYAGAVPAPMSEGYNEFARRRNEVNNHLRRVNSMAALFPKNAIMNELFAITGGMKEDHQLLSPESLEKLFDAVDNIRQEKALIDPAILD